MPLIKRLDGIEMMNNHIPQIYIKVKKLCVIVRTFIRIQDF